jgi:micrococcal nuclease
MLRPSHFFRLFASSPFRLFAFFVFAFSPFPRFPSSSFAATVANVIDGDTIVLTGGTRVRYLGVNTPEYGQPFYEEAKRYNERLVLNREVRLETRGQAHDGYGRTLAYVYVGDVLVNARLIAAGLGHLFVIGSLDRYEEWLRLQKDAQAQHKGMWRNGVPGPLKITTVHADAEGDDRRNPNGEYVRICNVSNGPVDLRGFSIHDSGPYRYVFPGGTLEPGYTALLLSGKGRDNTTSRRQLTFYWGSGPVWNNDGDTASLFDANDKLIDSFRVQGEINE